MREFLRFTPVTRVRTFYASQPASRGRGQPFLSLQTLRERHWRKRTTRAISPNPGSVFMTMPLIKGTLDVLVLKALSWGPMHGFEITSWLEERSASQIAVDDSALYQALHRMEERGLVLGEWGVTENNRRARFYKVTATGRAHLKAEAANLVRYASTVTSILEARGR